MKNSKNLDKYLLYQPKVDLRTLEVIGLEALIRFVDRESLNILDTETMINSIECLDDMMILTNDVFNIVFKDIKKLDAMDYKINISINMSPEELCNVNIPRWVDEKFKNYKEYINRIEIEITERHKIENIEIMREKINLLKKLGFTISIDDLGSGFNKIDMIENYDVDVVKIDKSMVKNFKNRKEDINNIVKISNERNIDLLAEGIESKIDFQRFLHLGFKFGQGYYFHRPMSIDAVIEVISMLKK